MYFLFNITLIITAIIVLLFTKSSCLCAAAESESLHDDFVNKASLTYKRIVPCLKARSDAVPLGFVWDNMKFPDDAIDHYRDLLARTLMYRTGVEPHKYTGYSDDWIENRFIKKFSRLRLDQFGGFIPIFVQWTDIHVHHFMKETTTKPTTSTNSPNSTTFLTLHQTILSMLRPTVLYVAVTQDDEGLFQLSKLAPNILSISGGGYGNIPIPLIKGEIPHHPINVPALGDVISYEVIPKKSDDDRNNNPADDTDGRKYAAENMTVNATTTAWSQYISFVGNPRPGLSRSKLLKDLSNVLNHQRHGRSNMRLTFYSGKAWIHKISSTMFNLAPRGFGRTSFRLAEVIQMGRIPVYMYDDVPWIPYAGTEISLQHFGYILGPKDYQNMAKTFQSDAQNVTELRRKLLQVMNIRRHYTYEGVLSQLEMFFTDPFGESGGHLRCNKLPSRSH